MSLCYREQRRLRGVEAGLFRSDSHLAGMLEMFGRLYSSQDMPASEQVPPGQGATGEPSPASRRHSPSPPSLSASCSVRRSPRQLGPARPRPATGRPARAHRARPRSRRPAEPSRTGSPVATSAAPDAPWPARPRLHPAADHRGIHPERAIAAHPVGDETRSRVLKSGGITIKMVIRGTSAGFADAW